MDLPQLISAAAEANKKAQEAYEAYATLKSASDVLRQQTIEKLHETGLKSAKNDNYSASISIRPSIMVVDETQVIEWIKKNKMDLSIYTGLKKTAFDPIAKAALQKTGEIVPGTQIIEKESITIRSNKK